MISNPSALIVWIDDHFLTPTWREDESKKSWHTLFGNIQSNVYRQLDIGIKFITTAEDALEFINEDRFSANTYYYFIVDRKLPYQATDQAIDSNSEDIIHSLLKFKEHYNNFDFSVLSSGDSNSYGIKNINYFQKPQNKEFTLPDELRHKVLLYIKRNVNFINQQRISQIHKIENYPSIENVGDSWLYPFMDGYRTFVEIEELTNNNYQTLIVLSENSISDKFIQQSLYISLHDVLVNFDGIKYYLEEDYQSFKNKGHYDQIFDDTNYIPIIRLRNWDNYSYQKFDNMLKNRLKVFVIDSDDDNVSSYIDSSKNARVIKIDGLNNNQDTKYKLTFSMINQLLNSSKMNLKIKNSVYNTNKELFLHPLMYTLIIEPGIHIEALDDPSEVIHEISQYFKNMTLHQENIELESSKPIKYNTEYIYKRAKKLITSNKDYNQLILKTIKFWLKNSWNVNYNINLIDFIELENIWQENAFNILKELLFKLDFSLLDTKDKINMNKIKNTIAYIEDNEDNRNLSTHTAWPHQVYPLSSFIQNKVKADNNKSLYFHNNNLSYIDYSSELALSNEILENKLDYYRDVFSLIERTKDFLPLDAGDMLSEISQRIQKEKSTFNPSLDNEFYKKLSNIILRIPIFFGEIILGQKVDFELSDKAGFGKLVEVYRDKILNKLNVIPFSVVENLQCIGELNNLDFLENNSNLNEKRLYSSLKLDKQNFNKKGKGSLIDLAVDKDTSDEYKNRILKLENIDLISQTSTFVSSLIAKEQKLKIAKYKDCYILMSYFTDTRNMWEHKHNDLWNEDRFKEFFIYSYESIWQMQKIILETLGSKKDVKIDTKYIIFDSEIKLHTNVRFSNIEEYDNYFKDLYKDICVN